MIRNSVPQTAPSRAPSLCRKSAIVSFETLKNEIPNIEGTQSHLFGLGPKLEAGCYLNPRSQQYQINVEAESLFGNCSTRSVFTSIANSASHSCMLICRVRISNLQIFSLPKHNNVSDLTAVIFGYCKWWRSGTKSLTADSGVECDALKTRYCQKVRYLERDVCRGKRYFTIGSCMPNERALQVFITFSMVLRRTLMIGFPSTTVRNWRGSTSTSPCFKSYNIWWTYICCGWYIKPS